MSAVRGSAASALVHKSALACSFWVITKTEREICLVRWAFYACWHSWSVRAAVARRTKIKSKAFPRSAERNLAPLCLNRWLGHFRASSFFSRYQRDVRVSKCRTSRHQSHVAQRGDEKYVSRVGKQLWEPKVGLERNKFSPLSWLMKN